MISMKKTSRVSPRNVKGTGSVDVEMTDATPEDQVDGKFEFMFVSMGQGECTLIRCPDGRVGMIDCGSKAYSGDDVSAAEKKRVMSEIGQGLCNQIDQWTGNYTYPDIQPSITNKNVLDFLILTHCDGDHYNKIVEFIPTTITIRNVYFSDGPNSVGPDSKYSKISEPYSVKKPKSFRSMNKYLGTKKDKLGSRIMDRRWDTEEVIEVVINGQEQCYYTYNLESRVRTPATDNGGSNSNYGIRNELNEAVFKVVSGNQLGGWDISIVGGNVLKTYETIATTGKRRLLAQPESNKIQKREFKSTDEQDESLNSGESDPIDPIPKTTSVEPPYTDSITKNTASLCTRISYKNENNLSVDNEEVMLLMGDATNTTFKFLNSSIDEANYVLSNIPHHSSAVHCNDFNSSLDETVVPLNFIQGKLRPKSVVASCRPLYKSFFFPPANVLSNYEEVVSTLETPHNLDVWHSVAPNGGSNWVADYYDQNKDDYEKKGAKTKKKDKTFYVLKESPPPVGSLPILIPAKGLYLSRETTFSNIKIPDLNFNCNAGAFRAIYRVFPEPTA